MSNGNRLSRSNSPYLLQHAENPVDWHPWGEEAFAKARDEDKPVFLSIGYATCHWCHVMAHESFEDEQVARLMNQAFINIKVDREQRPDIDNTYMFICQMLTGRGGWPLTIVMSPDKQPFYAATYIPKTGRHRQPGMVELIPRLSQLWKEERGKVTDSAKEITQAFQQSIEPATGKPLPQDILRKTYTQLLQQFDSQHGGFSGAPKFPTPHTLTFLLRYGHRFDEEEALNMAEKTLTEMRHGGLFDHIGYGFHRYSTDNKWLVPHFEKMLYDQAMLLMAYSEGWQVTKNPLFRQTAQQIATYLLRDLQHPEGAFFSAEDADSEGEEGLFYLWSIEQVRELLPAADAELAIEVFNMKPEGNYTDEATGQRTGKNILHQTTSLAALAAERSLSEETLGQKLEHVRTQLFNAREQRERPFLDDKILTDWNGLAVAALAKAGRILGKAAYIEQAKQAAGFIFQHLTDQDGRLLHCFRNGKASIAGTADDYAFFIWGLTELYEATFNPTYLEKAVAFNHTFLASHWDDQADGFFFSGENSEELLGRKKEFFDSALPSANSIAMMNLLRLGRMTATPKWEQKADTIAQQASPLLQQTPSSFTQLLQAQLWAEGPNHEIVIAGKKGNKDARKLLNNLNDQYLPHAVVLLNDQSSAIQSLAPYLKDMPPQGGKATAYVCQNYSCQLPTNDAEEMMELLH